jgi:predicted PurR-regulated permease PerM
MEQRVPEARAVPVSVRSFLTLATILLAVAALYWAQLVLIPLALAMLLVFILSPAVTALQRRRVPRVAAVLLVVTAAFMVLAGIGLATVLQIRSLAQELPRRKNQIAAKISGLLGSGKGTFLESLETSIQDISNQVLNNRQEAQRATVPPDRSQPELIGGLAGTGTGPFPGDLPWGGLYDHSQEMAAHAASNGPKEVIPVQIEQSSLTQLGQAMGPAAEFLATSVMVVVLVIFMLIRREDLRNRMVRLFGRGSVIVTTRAIDEAAQRISRYLMMQLLINSGFGLAICLGLWLFGVPHAFLWGLLCGMLRFVPYVGTWLGAALLLVYTVAISDGWSEPLLVFGLFLVIELTTANALEPLLFGHSTGISSVALLVAAAFWTWLWGPIGLVLSTPITACLVVLGKYVPQLEFFNVLLGDEPVLDAEVSYYQRLLAHDQDEATELVEKHLQGKPLQTVYDEVLLPALILAKRDRERGELSPEDEHFILQATRDVLTDLVLPQQKLRLVATQGDPHPEADAEQILIFGCPARKAEDELALEMLQQLLASSRCQVELLSAQTLSGELVTRVEKEQPALVCLAALPPGGLSMTRYLCKRLRAHFPNLKIVVGCWGHEVSLPQMRERLLAVGANAVGATLLETQNQIVPLVQAARHQQVPPAESALEPAGRA